MTGKGKARSGATTTSRNLRQFAASGLGQGHWPAAAFSPLSSSFLPVQFHPSRPLFIASTILMERVMDKQWQVDEEEDAR